jgi:hypothetical protein
MQPILVSGWCLSKNERSKPPFQRQLGDLAHPAFREVVFMTASSFLLVLLMMWGIVAAIYSVLFFPDIVKALRHDHKTARPAHDLKHWGRHVSHTA